MIENENWISATRPKTPQNCCKLSICYRLVANCQQFATNLSISLSCNKSVKIRLVATCHLQTCYNLLKQLASSLWITSFDNQRATNLLITCNSLVVNKLSQTSWYRLAVTGLSQDVNRLVSGSVGLDQPMFELHSTRLTKTRSIKQALLFRR